MINPYKRTQPGQIDKERQQWEQKRIVHGPVQSGTMGSNIKKSIKALDRMSTGRDGRR